MKILILGGEGMIGHALVRALRSTQSIGCTIRTDHSDALSRLGDVKTFTSTDVLDADALRQAMAIFRPEAVINAVGIVKQKLNSGDEIKTIELNSIMPHKLALLARDFDFKLIQLSTDCVFSGRKGNYTEADIPDATDLYGRTKVLGEINDDPRVLTLRVSTIGLEVNSQKGLIEWFLSQGNKVRGYRKAIYTGFTSLELSRILDMILRKFPSLSGIYHISSEPISKYALLMRVQELTGKTDVQITPDDNFVCDRSLNSSRFRLETGYVPPSWPVMLEELAFQIKQRGMET